MPSGRDGYPTVLIGIRWVWIVTQGAPLIQGETEPEATERSMWMWPELRNDLSAAQVLFKRDRFTHTLYSWASRNRQDPAPTEVVKSRRVRTRGCSAPKPAWYWQATPLHEALWSYLDLCGSTWSVAGTRCLVDTGYKPRRDSSSIYASGVAATGGTFPGNLAHYWYQFAPKIRLWSHWGLSRAVSPGPRA